MKSPMATSLPRVDMAHPDRPLAERILALPDAGLAAGLFGLALLIRLPFRTQILYHWDSVNFAFAMRSFDLAKEQPHPPGYILYVWLARLVDLLIGSEPATLVALSVAASAVAVAAMYLLGARMFDGRTGLLAGIFLAVSPLFWFYSEIALPHTLDAAMVILFVWLAYGAMQGDVRQGYFAAVTLALAGGLRPQTLVFMLPVLLYALRRVGLRHFVSIGATGVLICLLWFVPLAASAGGVAAYFDILGSFANRFQQSTSVLMGAGVSGVGANAAKLVQYTLFAWGAAIFPALLGLFLSVRSAGFQKPDARTILLWLWLGPVLVFYLLIHMGQQGLVFVYLPVLFLWSARGLLSWNSGRLRTVLAVLVIALNASVFLVLPEFPLGTNGPRLLTRSTLARSDRYYHSRFEAIQNHFQDETVVILAVSWHHVEYYLPNYPVIPYGIGTHGAIVTPLLESFQLDPGKVADVSGDENGTWRVVLFDPPLLDALEPGLRPSFLPLDAKTELAYIELDSSRTLILGPAISYAPSEQP